MPQEFIGVDFDGVLVEYHGFQGDGVFGDPIQPMVEKVRSLLREGKDVRIFTSRMCPTQPKGTLEKNRQEIQRFCQFHFGQQLWLTALKEPAMKEFYDDRAIQMITNTGRPLASFAEKMGKQQH
jgi:hypothetical protein